MPTPPLPITNILLRLAAQSAARPSQPAAHNKYTSPHLRRPRNTVSAGALIPIYSLASSLLRRLAMRKKIIALFAAAALAAPLAFADDWVNPKAVIPPEAKQNRISGGESFPP